MTTDKPADDAEHVRWTIRLEKAQKEAWEDYKDDSAKYTSLADLVRKSVEAEIAGKQGGGDGDMAHEFTDVKELLEDLSRSVRSMNSRIESLEAEIQAEHDIQDLASEVFSRLPKKDEFREWHGGQGENHELGRYPKEERTQLLAEKGGDAVAMADILDVTEKRLREAIAQLQADTHMVRSAEKGGEIRYYREV